MRNGSPKNILVRDLDAQNRETENVSSKIHGDIVTFEYDGGIGDPELLSTPSIARYRLSNNDAKRIAPIALTRAGFIREWLDMHDVNAAADLRRGFRFERVARCEGSPEFWDVAVRSNSGKTYVFGIAGSRADELKMVAMNDKPDPACKPEDLNRTRAGIATELPH